MSTILTVDQIEDIVGQFERSMGTFTGPSLDVYDFSGALRTILTNQGNDDEGLVVAVHVTGLPLHVPSDLIAKGVVEALADADTLLWGRVRGLWFASPNNPTIAFKETDR